MDTGQLELRSAVAWRDGRLEAIDQTLLPERLVVLELRTVAEVVDALRRLAIHGESGGDPDRRRAPDGQAAQRVHHFGDGAPPGDPGRAGDRGRRRFRRGAWPRRAPAIERG